MRTLDCNPLYFGKIYAILNKFISHDYTLYILRNPKYQETYLGFAILNLQIQIRKWENLVSCNQTSIKQTNQVWQKEKKPIGT